MTQPHDTSIGWKIFNRNLGQRETITVDMGYDWDELRRKLRENGVRPVIKHREFSSLDKAYIAQIDDITHHR